jgi:hypothetical protein
VVTMRQTTLIRNESVQWSVQAEALVADCSLEIAAAFGFNALARKRPAT